MSALTRTTSAARQSATRVATVRWRVSGAIPGQPHLATDQSEQAIVEVVIDLARQGVASAAARVLAGGRVVDLGAGAGTWLEEGGLLHIDVAGVLSLTGRRSETGLEVLYARAEVLHGLAIPGGRYEVDTATVEPGP